MPLIVLSLLSFTCSHPASFPPFRNVTRVVIRSSPGKVVGETTNPQRIAAIVQFANEELNGWGAPFTGIPVPDTAAEMYAAGTFLGHLGVGHRILETQRAGTFLSKSISAHREAQFRNLLAAATKSSE